MTNRARRKKREVMGENIFHVIDEWMDGLFFDIGIISYVSYHYHNIGDNL